MPIGMYNNVDMYRIALDAAWVRNEAIAGNIANASTPGYKRKDVAFEEYLQQATKARNFKGYITHERHIPICASKLNYVKPRIIQDNSNFSMRIDGNNVDIENEMALLAKNGIVYNTIIQKASGELRKLSNVINEGRR